MERKPLIVNAWVRIGLFLISLLAAYMLLSFATSYLPGLLGNEKSKAGEPGLQRIGYILPLLISIVASFVTVYIFRKKVDRRSVYSLGFAFRGNRSSAATGLFLGLLLLGAGTFALVLNNNLQWNDVTFDPSELFTGFGLLLLVAFAEELVFRGYILNNLLRVTNKWMALVVSAVVFALFHATNPGVNWLPVINIFLAGLMLGINYIYTKNLWYGILLHFTWNFYMGYILGYKVSGLQFQSLLQQDLSGNALLTGGSFGFEGSVIASLLFMLAVVTIGFIYQKKEVQV